MQNRIRDAFAELIQHERRKAEATNEDELQDALADQAAFRARSVLASVVYSIVDIQRAHPALLPLIAVLIGLRLFF